MIPALEHLSPESLRCLARARQEAKRTGKRLIGTEHLLCGTVLEAKGEFKKVLKQAGLTAASVTKAADEIAGTNPAHEDENLELTPRTQRVLSGAAEEASKLNSKTIGPQHILLCMLRNDAGLASRIMEKLSINTKALITSLLS